MRFHVERSLVAVLLAFTALESAAGEQVSFPGAGVELVGRLYRPAGAGPFPALVLMHGCSGMWRRDGREPTAAYAAWAEHWRSRGYVALLVDSFGPRGQREICTQRTRTIRPDRERPLDAYAALRWLQGRADVVPTRVHLQGWSNGGSTVLYTVRQGATGQPGGGPDYRSAVAFYPGCAQLVREPDFRTRVPLLIQAGEADDWTPARHCEALAEKFRARGAGIEIDVYPGAHHAFDGLGAVRDRPAVSNPSSPTGMGATVGAHPVARAESFRRTTDWVAAKDR